MFFLFIIIFIVFINGLKEVEQNKLNEQCLSISNTKCLEGFFVLLVFFRHFIQYVDLTAPVDLPLKAIDSYLGQLIVVPFLFFTGYGTMNSLMNKGEQYAKSMISKFAKLLFNFDCCILLFYIYGLFAGQNYPLKRVLLSFTGWSSIGNSNWYVFCILSFYLFVYVAFYIFKCFRKERNMVGIVVITVLFALYCVILKHVGNPSYWYNTTIILPFGMTFCLAKKQLFRIIKDNTHIYTYILGILLITFVLARQYWGKSIIFYFVADCAFITLIILLLLKYNIKSNLLQFFGNHVFSVYILQRLAFMLFVHIGIKKPFNLFVAALGMTIITAVLFDKVIEYIHSIIINQITIKGK